jgi:hypothetical protein
VERLLATLALVLASVGPVGTAEQGQEVDHAQMDHSKMGPVQGDVSDHQEMSGMQGMYGTYPPSRETSGTSWQPDSSTHEGIHRMSDTWSTMIHGIANAIYDHQGGPRGATETFSTSMLMLMGQRPLGSGTLGLKGMVSLDPLMGKRGYPELLQTGETADGKTPLIDRQHPHDLFMELSASYKIAAGFKIVRHLLTSACRANPRSARRRLCIVYPASIIQKRRLPIIGSIRLMLPLLEDESRINLDTTSRPAPLIRLPYA